VEPIMQERILAFRRALEELDQPRARSLFALELQETTPLKAVENLVVPALEQIGDAWQRGDVALSQIYLSGRFCERLVDEALPAADPARKRQPRSAIVTLCDNHLLGKRIVYATARACGFELFDFGSMDVETLIARAINERIQILLISTLMLPSALKAAEAISKLRSVMPKMRVIVGGAPFLFDAQLWREVGADAMGHNAGEAVTLLEAMMQEVRHDAA